jgi:hypothetical protein
MPRYPINASSAAALAAAATPPSGTALEALPWDLHETNTATFATATANINAAFFQTVFTDKTQGNMESAGQLPSPQWMELAGYCCDILAIPATGTALLGPISDIANLLKAVRGTFYFSLSNKIYGYFPLTLAHSTGGEVGFYGATLTAPAQVSYGNNGVPDGGWWIDGAITIPSQQNFALNIITSATATTFNQTPLPVRSNLWGVLHRRVL